MERTTATNASQARRVAVVSRFDATGGGASRVAENLTEFLNGRQGFKADHWIAHQGENTGSQYQMLHGRGLIRFLRRSCAFLSRQAGFTEFLTPELLIHLWNKNVNYDIYHFHDISSVFSPMAVRWLGRRLPVVWTFHDCSAFTAGCIYPMGCTAFHSCCGDCPQLDIWPLETKIDATRIMYRYKKNTARAGVYIPVAPSQWMADEAMKSGMFRERPRVIPYGVDSGLFRPLPAEEVRDELRLPRKKFIVLLNVHSLEDPRKGVIDAIQAVERLAPAPLLIALGAVSPQARKLFRHLDTLFLGYLTNRPLLARYCAAADILLFPTHADNLPNAVLEAMACGTPTVGYRTGGIPDMVEHRVNGWLADRGDVEGLSTGLNHARSDPGAVGEWSANCRDKALKSFSNETFIDAHMKLYEEILDRDSGLLPHLGVR